MIVDRFTGGFWARRQSVPWGGSLALMNVGISEGEARSVAERYRGLGFNARVYERSIRAGGAGADLWVVVVRERNARKEQGDAG